MTARKGDEWLTRPQRRVLELLRLAGEGIGVWAIADRVGLSTSETLSVLRSLERRGLASLRAGSLQGDRPSEQIWAAVKD